MSQETTTTMKTITLLLLTVFGTCLPAQIEEDPRAKMQEILDKVAEEMRQIDELLQRSSRPSEARNGMQQAVEKLDKLLDDVGKTQERVVKGIDELLEQAEKMKSQQGGQGKDPFDQQQQQERQQGQQQREEQQQRQRRPERPQQRDQEQQQAKGELEKNEREEREKGENKPSAPRPDDAKEKADGKRLQGAWGELPDYLLEHGRGSMPDVPEKYRKYLEAMTKQKQ